MNVAGIEPGFCQCGCGRRVRMVTKERPLWGYKPGEYIRCLQGHGARKHQLVGYQINEATGCWEWTGSMHSGGYGLINQGDTTIYAHRWSWEASHGPVPDGYELHHVCHNQRCINPEHLRLVTRKEHLSIYHRKTHCVHGHPFVGDNVYIRPDTGTQQCRACARIHDAKRRPRGKPTAYELKNGTPIHAKCREDEAA